MTARVSRIGALAVPVATLTIWVASSLPPLNPRGPSTGDVLWDLSFAGFPVVGLIITLRQPTNRVGWMLSGIGLGIGLSIFYVDVLRFLYASPDYHNLVPWLVGVQPFDLAAWGLLLTLIVTFPDGRLSSRGSRWLVVGFWSFLGLVVVDDVITPVQRIAGLPVSALAQPTLARILDSITSFDVNGLVVLAAVVGLGFRFRRGSATTRQQIKWFALSALVLVVCAVAGGVIDAAAHRNDIQSVLQALGLVSFAAGIGVAVVKHRLYDVDLVISRGLTYAALLILALLVYVALVVGVGTLVGQTTRSNLVLSITATAVVAVAFRPVQVWLQDAANRLVYGRRQTPYESLSGFTRRLAEDYGGDGILQRMADTLALGVKARCAAVYIRNGEADVLAAIAPAAAEAPRTSPDGSFDVRHRGQALGSLAIWTHGGEVLAAAETRLLTDLAVQAGLVMHNARLTVELEQRLEELRASRRRLVAAQDAERRRLERDLHDGAQHDLVAVRMKLGLAEGEAAATGSRLTSLLAEVREETAAALENIRQLSRGLYPPLLESQGLAAALSAHSRRLSIPVEVRASDMRFSREVETAVYFCCVEALQNASKHARASRAWILVDLEDSELTFEIGDDGHGFDPAASRRGAGLQNITDRIEALGGEVRIGSDPSGTRIRGALTAERRTSLAQGAVS